MSRILRNDPARRVQDVVLSSHTGGFTDADLDAVDPADAEWMAEHLAGAARSLHQLRKRLLSRAGHPPTVLARPCAACGGSMTGRQDQRYCSSACRQRAHRLRRNGSDS